MKNTANFFHKLALIFAGLFLIFKISDKRGNKDGKN